MRRQEDGFNEQQGDDQAAPFLGIAQRDEEEHSQRGA